MKIFELFSNIKHSQAFFFIELSDESDKIDEDAGSNELELIENKN